MLTAARKSGHYKATCDTCQAILEVEALDFDLAWDALRERGWREAAVRGQHRSRWFWWCPDCAPKPP